jgi:hypothetical protein
MQQRYKNAATIYKNAAVINKNAAWCDITCGNKT